MVSVLNSTLSMVWVITSGKQFVLFLQMFLAVNMHYHSKQNLLHIFSTSLNICKLSFLKLESFKIKQQIVLVSPQIFFLFSVYNFPTVHLQIAYQDLS